MFSDIFEMLSWINICWELVKIIFYAETTAIEKLTELKVDRVTQTLIMQNTAALLSLYSQDRRARNKEWDIAQFSWNIAQ